MRNNHVHIQLEGMCAGGVIVTDKTPTSFRVVHTPPGSAQQCDAPFSYRITARRPGFETLRLATVAEARAATAQFVQSEFPERVTEANQKRTAAENQMAASFPSNPGVSTPDAPPSIDDITPAVPTITLPTPGAKNQSDDEILPPSPPPSIPGE